MNCYTAYGLHIASDIELPHALLCEAGASRSVEEATGLPDLVIRLDPCAGSEITGVPGHIRQDGADSLVLSWPRVARYTLRCGRYISVEPSPNAAPESVQAFLVGTVLALLLQQRGFLVLHASAVAMGRGPDARAVAFVGRSGEGKSTMAAAIHASGCALVADDFIALAPEWGTSLPLVAPGMPALRLSPPSLRAIGQDENELSFLHPPAASGASSSTRREPRRVWPSRRGFQTCALPLARIYLLESDVSASPEAVQSSRLAPRAAMMELLEHLICRSLSGSAESGAQFRLCGELARGVPMLSLRRPRDLSRLNECVQHVLLKGTD